MIKSWQIFLESSVSYEDEVASICKQYGIKNWSINSSGMVDVDWNVYLCYKDLNKLPLQFGKVSGSFECQNNRLTSLEGCPREVGDYFYCHYNKLVTLNDCPKFVDNNFICSNNKLTSLEGCPNVIDGYFYCNDNNLITLEGCPNKVRNQFRCQRNRLWSLEGLVSAGSIYADDNPITNLTTIGETMISKKISFLESVILNIEQISNKELKLIFQKIDTQNILDLNNFRIFDMLRKHLPKKYAQIMKLQNVDLSADLGELGF